MSLKTILKAPKCTSTIHIHETLNMPTLQQRRDEHCSTQMYKVSKNLAPSPILKMFKKQTPHGNMRTRRQQQGNYIVPKCNLVATSRNFRLRGVQMWEKIPTELKSSKSLAIYKKGVRKYWTGNYPNGIT